MFRRPIILLAVAALVLSACAAPTRQYIAADAYGMYFALPVEWQQVPDRQLRTAEQGWTDDAGNVLQQTMLWQGAWSPAQITANTVFQSQTPKQPVVFAFVRNLINVEQQGIGTDIAGALADIVAPVTSLDARQVVQHSVAAGRFRGIRQTVTYPVHGVMQRLRVAAMLGPSKDRVYVVSVRCSRNCFVTNTDAINAIFTSLTFKEPRA